MSLFACKNKETVKGKKTTFFRPVSNLSFISKCVEKVVAAQTRVHVDDNNLSDLYQSAYKNHHSTETALIKV